MLQLSALLPFGVPPWPHKKNKKSECAAQEHNIHVHAEDTEVWQSHPTNDMHILRLGV